MFLSKIYKELNGITDDLGIGLTIGLVSIMCYVVILLLKITGSDTSVSLLPLILVLGGLGMGMSIIKGCKLGLVFQVIFVLLCGLIFALLNDLHGFAILTTSILIIMLSEFIFLIEAQLEKKKYDLRKTVFKKAESILEASLVIINILNARYFVQELNLNWETVYPILTTLLKYVLGGVWVIVAIYMFLRINEGLANYGKRSR